MQPVFRAMVSSDWSECLSPNGPFDVIGYHYPDLQTEITTIFRKYTGNQISLSHAVQSVAALLPAPITAQQMDDYLADCFRTYPGVPELIDQCRKADILFMINTTGMVGYFQRVFRNGLLPVLPALSAHPMVRFDGADANAFDFHPLGEIADKATNTAAVAARFHIPHDRIVIMGDSGGDGPHFDWGARVGAQCIGVMVKPSLDHYCRRKGVVMAHRFGHAYMDGEPRSLATEMTFDYKELLPVLRSLIAW